MNEERHVLGIGEGQRSAHWLQGERQARRQAKSGARGPGDDVDDGTGAPWPALDVKGKTWKSTRLTSISGGLGAILGGGDVTQRRAGEGDGREGEARRDRVWARAQGKPPRTLVG
ncbi:hypothetical protein ES705_30206 [subsurface metagenome]